MTEGFWSRALFRLLNETSLFISFTLVSMNTFEQCVRNNRTYDLTQFKKLSPKHIHTNKRKAME